jgi:hypothetical protein
MTAASTTWQVLAQPALQFLHPRGQRGDLRVPRRELRGGQLIPRRRRLPQPGVHRLQLRYPPAQPGHISRRRIRRIGHKPHSTTAGDPLSTNHAEPAKAKLSATQTQAAAQRHSHSQSFRLNSYESSAGSAGDRTGRRRWDQIAARLDQPDTDHVGQVKGQRFRRNDWLTAGHTSSSPGNL